LSQTPSPKKNNYRNVVANKRIFKKLGPPAKKSPDMEGPGITEKIALPQSNIWTPAGRKSVSLMIPMKYIRDLRKEKIVAKKNTVVP
jgi:hypothetical protein